MRNKTLLVAGREYRSTVLTKAFIFGAIIMPIVIWTLAIAIPMLVETETPKMEGTIAIIDETGQVAPLLTTQLSPAFLKQTREALASESIDGFLEKQAKAMGATGGEIAKNMAMVAGKRALEKRLEQPDHELEFETHHSEDAFEALKADVRAGKYLAVILIQPDALELNPNYMNDLLSQFTGALSGAPDNVDQDQPEKPEPEAAATIVTQQTMHPDNSELLRSTVTNTLIGQRIMVNQIDIIKAQEVLTPPWVEVRNTTETGEVKSNEFATMFVPFGFMMLLWISTFTGGQYLLTTTIEEKSSKIIEVLLSATSPMQLMTGKILGQGAVALTMLALYGALAYFGLKRTDFGYLIEPAKFIIVIPFFIMAFFFIACMMASIGSAVNEMREAQALMGPVMMIMILPFLAWMPIVSSPNGSLATISSFIPPLTPFVMALRLGGNQVIPAWQIVATIVIGFAAVGASMWATGKIFRIGVLMHGKAPNIATLLRWVRQS